MDLLPTEIHPNGKRLLALDGGGVRGVASLVMLQTIMKLVQKRRGLGDECRPVDYFELAAGTSTGGIIGIMLFRLRMTTTQAIKQYDKIAKQVFSPKLFGCDISWAPTVFTSLVNQIKTLIWGSRFDDESLKKAIDQVVEDFGVDSHDKAMKGQALLRHDGVGRMVVCTTAQDRAETVLMRTYEDRHEYASSIVNNIMKEHQDEITISLAARCTSAAPTFFPDVKWPDAKENLTFWDGGVLNNNPIDQLWYSRYETVKPTDPQPKISCVISLGTGYLKPKSLPRSWFKRLIGVASSVINFATNTNAKGKDFSRHMKHLNERAEYKDTKYIRFNPDLKGEEIGLDEYRRMEELKKIASSYMQESSNQKFIEQAVDAICPPNHSPCLG